ncbi:MAG: hypothetical protein JW811_04295 [Clostridiales bacterium]|nr:hypothetical protein [Clostridiales bacterium]
MKHIYRIFILFLALALFTADAAAAEGTFTFRNGVTWDTTPEEMLNAEGLRLSSARVHSRDYNGYSFISIKEEGMDDESVFYIFREGELFMAYTTLPKDTGTVGVFDDAAAKYSVLYGTPVEMPGEVLSMMYNIFVPGSTVPEDFGRLLAWWLSDGTLAVLLGFRGTNVMSYLHEQRILDAGEAALAADPV